MPAATLGDGLVLVVPVYFSADCVIIGMLLDTIRGQSVYTVFLLNHGWAYGNQVESLEAAKALAAHSGFECTIYLEGQLIGSYSPLSGFQTFVE